MISIIRRSVSNIRNYSTTVDSSSEVLFNVINNVGIITLNRPKALNALNKKMVVAICNKLREWEHERSFVIVEGAGDKSFCAGGDVVAVTKDKHEGKLFFKNEYKMNYLIGTYRIPYISILDGITMGGGVGISVHGRYRIATEKTLFAMPETAIGLFPDVGGSYFLPKLKRNLGIFLGLTGHRLQGADVVNAGIATHFVPRKDILKFKENLIKVSQSDLPTFLAKETVDVSKHPYCLCDREKDIEKYFAKNTVEEIIEGLREDNDEWRMNIANMIENHSPTALKITKSQLNRGLNLDLKQCLIMEFRLSCAALDKKISPDFYEGVRAQLIDKDKSPKWDPQSLKDVSSDMVEKAFEALPADEELDI